MRHTGSAKWWRHRLLKRKSMISVGAGLGLLLEAHVEKILEEMRRKGEIVDFRRHPHYSPADRDGKDFTVVKKVGDAPVGRSFGVTISSNSWRRACQKHPKVPTFWFPRGQSTDPDEIRKTVLNLFQVSQAQLPS